MIKKSKKLWCFLGFHDVFRCERVPVFPDSFVGDKDDWMNYEHRFHVEPFSPFTVVETKYKCSDCGRTFYEPSGNFNQRKMDELIYRETMRVSNELWKNGEYDEAINLLR